MEKAFVVFCGAIVLAIAALFCVLIFFLVGSMLGETHYQYRCHDGVMEKRDVTWGVPTANYSPLNGVTCAEVR